MAKLVGIEVTSQLIKVATMASGKKGLKILNTLSIETPQGAVVAGTIKNPDAVAEKVKEMAAILKFSQNDNIYLACGGSDVTIQCNVYSNPDMEEWRKDVEKGIIGDATPVVTFAYVQPKLKDGKIDFLVTSAAISKDYIKEISIAFKKYDMRLSGIEPSLVAQLRYFTGIDDRFTVIDVNADFVSMTSFYEEIGFWNTISSDGSLKIMANKEEYIYQLQQELQRHFVGAEHQMGFKTNCVVITGVEDSLKDYLVQRLGNASSLNGDMTHCMVVDGSYLPEIVINIEEDDRAFLTPIGLCMHEYFNDWSADLSKDEGLHRVLVGNVLSKGDLQELHWERLKKKMIIAMSVTGIFLGVIFTYFMSAMFWMDNPQKKMTTAFEQEFAKAEKTKAENVNLIQQIQLASSERYRIVPVIDEMNKSRKGIAFNKFSVDVPTKKMTIEGFTGATADINGFLQETQFSTAVKNVQMSDVTPRGETTVFKLSATIQ